MVGREGTTVCNKTVPRYRGRELAWLVNDWVCRNGTPENRAFLAIAVAVADDRHNRFDRPGHWAGTEIQHW